MNNDKLRTIRKNAHHGPIKFGLSRFCNEYSDLQYGERVRLENSLSIADVKALDYLKENESVSATEVEKVIGQDLDLSKFCERGLFEKKKNRYSITKKGQEAWEAIVLYCDR